MINPNNKDTKDIRWKQRFENFLRSYELLQKAILIENPSEVEQAGMFQFFETTIELAWKTLKDYLTLEKYQVKSPRGTIKQAFQIDLIQNGELWLKAIDDRNLIAHVYDEKTINIIEKSIKEKYFPLLKTLRDRLITEYE